MQAVLVNKGDTSVNTLHIGTTAKPNFDGNSNDLLVKIVSTALNRADISQRMGRYPPPPGESEILGLEM
jgi:NADPH:quinone reductase-like Zn-dependent oxidoreductase